MSSREISEFEDFINNLKLQLDQKE
jgi:hypothetical protein